MTSANILLANEIQNTSALKCFFFLFCDLRDLRNNKLASPFTADIYEISTCGYLRLLAQPAKQAYFFCILRRTEAKARRARSVSRLQGEEREKNNALFFFALVPSRTTRASRSPRFRLCSPKIRKKITRVLQATTCESVYPEL